MTLDELLAMIANTGFPIVVASYLILRMEEKLDKLNDTIRELASIIERQCH
ncbi:YvrJ family protein [Aedoeadaptatus coxii]|uniref:YvrJ family protein n=1 Tax=Aedoeadaptatus coxii TaxID=755172 RepID=UPI002AD2C4DA|nr:YvrJ family protein [Peptoniphilus coxii]